jgi:hypothetical protein
MPSTRPFGRRVAARICGLLAAVALVGVATAQSGVSPTPDFDIEVRFLGGFVAYVLLGGALVVFGPEYARETVAQIRSDPATSFFWGLLTAIGAPIAIALLAITIVGLVVAIPGIFLLAIVGLVGTAVSVVWLGSLALGTEEVGGKAAVVGALLLAIPASIPALGDLVTTLVGFFGTGVVARRLYAAWQDD